MKNFTFSIRQKAFILFAAALFLVNFSQAALTVTVTFTGTAPAGSTLVSGSPFSTLAAAITQLNASTFVGTTSVTLTCGGGLTETAPVGGYSITASGSASCPITITGATATISAFTPQATGSVSDAIFKLVGADYITLQGFTMQENASNSTIGAGGATSTNAQITNVTTGNNMTEWGVALFYTTTTNGAQNNTIQNNTISLNRTYTNTFGIYSNTRHASGTPTVGADATSAAGANSSNKVYGNNISNVMMGITFVGAPAVAVHDLGNDIGGSSAGTGNTITNWGGNTSTTSYNGNTGTSYCIFAINQDGDNISYNTITSATISGTAITVRGIFKDYGTSPTGTFTSNINNNTVTITDNFTSGTLECIRSQGMAALSTATININNNTILNTSIGGASTSLNTIGIANSSAPGVVSMSNNIIRGTTSTATSGTFIGILQNGAVVTTITLNGNKIGDASGNAITFSAANSGAFTGISNTAGAATAALSMQTNDFRGIVHSIAGSSTHIYLNNTAATLSQNISSNTFTNLNVNTSGSVNFVANAVTVPATGSMNVNSNSIVTAFNKGTAGGTVTFYSSNGSSATGSVINLQNNNFSNITVTGLTAFVGLNNTDGGSPTKTITGNTFSNISGGTGAINPMTINFMGAASSVSTNTITNISWGAAIAALTIGGSSLAATTLSVNNNIINNISTTSGNVTGISTAAPNTTTLTMSGNKINTLATSASASLYGIYVNGAAPISITRNKIYDIYCSNTGNGFPYGIYLFSNASANIFYNLIGDLRLAGNTSNGAPLSGIYINASTGTANVYYNTVNINATSTSGTIFYSAALFANTGTTLDMRNNILVNTSTPVGSGVVAAAFYRSGTTLSTYASTSNNNLFFAGTPSVSKLIYFDISNSQSTLAGYKAMTVPATLAPRDAASISVNPAFLSTAGSSANFLHLDPANGGNGTIDRGATPILTYTSDFDGDTRCATGCAGATLPDIGADEFTYSPPASDMAVTALNNPTSTSCHGATESVIVTIQNNGGTTVDYSVNNVTVTATGSGAAAGYSSSVVLTSGFLASLGTQNVTMPATLNTTAAGTYTITYTVAIAGVSDANSGNNSASSSPVSSGPLAVTIGGAGGICPAGANITLTATPTGGQSAFTWSAGWTTPGATSTRSVGTGTYNVTVTDACSVTASAAANFVVASYSAPTATITTSTPAVVCGTSPVTLTAGAGAGYVFKWSVTGASTTYTGLTNTSGGAAYTGTNLSPVFAAPAATTSYTLTVTDANTCTATALQSISVNGATTVTATATPSTVCSGGSTQLQATGAQVSSPLPNTYSFAATSGSFTPLSGATAIPGNSDSYFSGALPIGFTFPYNGTTYTNFYFSSNGFISFTTTIGTGTTNAMATTSSPILAPLWDDLDGASAGAASYLTAGSVGSRVLTVQWLNWEWDYGANAAVISFQVKIYEADGRIEFVYRQDAAAYNNAATGGASIGISGASGNYLSLNGTGTSPTASSSTATNSLNTKPATGQVYTFSRPAISFTYQWAADPSFTTATNIANPQASPTGNTTYTVTATATGGCTATASQAVTVAPLSVSVAGSPAAVCLGASSTLTATATGGCTPYATFVWSTGANTGTTNTLAVTPGSSGSIPYNVTVTDNTGNTASATVNITVNPVPAVTVSTVPATSAICGTGNVVMTANGSGGTGTLTYAWSPTTNLLPSGTVNIVTATPTVSRNYNVTVTDANTCTATAAKTVGVFGATTVTATATPSTVCPGGSTQLLATAAQVYNNTVNGYGFAGSTGSYAAITGTTLGAGSIGDDVGIGNLPIGFTFPYNGTTFTVFGARSNGLIELGQTTVTLSGYQGNSLSTTPNIIAPLWDDNNTTGGSIIYSTTGSVGSRILTVQWTGMHVGGTGSATNPTINMQILLYEATGVIQFIYGSTSASLSGTTASIGISGAAGNYESVTPLSPANTSTVSTSSENTGISTATNFPSGTIYTFTPATVPAFTYQWAAAASFTTATNIANPQASPTITTLYTVTVTATGGCTATVTQNVTVAPLSVTVAGSPAAVCLGASSTLTATATGGCLPYATFVWSTGANTGTTNTLAVTPGSSGSIPYNVTVTDNTGNTASATVNITVNPVPAVTVSTVPTNSAICGTGNVVMTANGSGGTGTLTYAWSPTTNLQPVAGNVSVETATPTVSRSYIVTVTDANTCTATATKTVSVYGATTVTTTATPSTVCPGGSTQLQATGAQVSSSLPNAYSFAASSGSFTPLTGATAIPGNSDSYFSGALPIGFTFPYNGTTYTNFYFSSNGFISFTTTIGTGTTNAMATTSSPILAPLWDDLDGASAGAASYLTAGSVGSRVLTVQWLNWEWDYGANAAVISFQVKIYEADGRIEFIYRQDAAAYNNASTLGASIGISGASGNYLSLNGTGTSPTASSSAATNSLNTKPATGQVYTFTPPAAPSFTYQWAADASFTTATNIANPQASPAGNTTYTVTVTATGGCTATVTQNVTVAPLSVSVAGSPATVCLGNASTLTATATGGCTPYATFVWSTGANTGATNTLSVTPGSSGSIPYNVTVTDNTGNTASATVNLTVTTPPSLSVTTVPATSAICGTGNVVMTANGSGGTGTLTYAWSPTTNLLPVAGNASVESASPTVSRTYNVTVTDANLCTATSTKTVSVYGATTVTATATPTVLCPGSTAQLQATGAQVYNNKVNGYGFAGSTGSYAAITGTTLGAGAIGDDVGIGNLPIGFTFPYNGTTFTVFGARSNGIIELGQTTVTLTGYQGNGLSTTPNIIAPLWDDNNTTGGSIIYSTTGSVGSRILTVQWTAMKVGNGGAGTATINMQILLYEATGVIQFIYGSTSAAFVSTTASIGISGAAGNYVSVTPLSPASSSTRSTTAENNNISSATNFPSGTIYTFTPGTAPTFTYQWAADASFITATNISNPQAAPVLTTVYTVTATEALGCTATATSTVSIIPLSVSVAGAPASVCLGRASTLTATPAGGCTPYATYVWSTGANTGTTNTLSVTPVSTGSVPYSVTVTDAIGNTASATLNLTVNPIPAVTIGTVPASSAICGTGNVVMTANGSGGTGSLSYAWSPTTNLQPVAGNVSIETATPTSSRTYNVTVTDANTCTATASKLVSVFGATTAIATATPASTCSGGSVQLQATAAQAGTQTANLYSFATSTGAALDPMTSSTTLLANSADDDVVTVTPSPSFAFAFEGTNYSTFTVSADGWLMFGTTVTQQNTNSVTSTTNVPKVYPLWDELATGSTGNVKYVITGTAPNRIMKVQWFVNIPYSLSANANSTFQLWLYETTNVVEFRYGTLGTPTSASISAGITGATSTNYNSITYSSNTSSNSAANNSNATKPASGRAYTFTPPPSTATFTYQWAASPTFTTATNIANPQATLTGTTNYTVTATEALGCTASASVSVSVAPVSVTSITTTPTVVCQNSTSTLTANVTGGCLPYSNYQWSTGANTSVNTLPVTPTSSGATIYRVTVTDAFSNTASAQISVTVIPAPSVTIGAAPAAASYCGTGSVVMTATATGGNGTYTYLWSPTTGLAPVLGTASIETASPAASTTYVVTVTDGNTCSASATRTVTVYPAVSVNVSPATVNTCSAVGATLTATGTNVQSYNGGGAVSIATLGNSTPYPSTFAVSGLATSGITIKSVNINGFTHAFSADADVLLQSPTGQTIALMSDVGFTASVSNANYTFQDGAATMSTSGANPSGIYKPTNSGVGTSDDNWTSPGPGSSYTPTATTLAAFTGNFNGAWNLYVVDDNSLDGGSINSWSITFNVPATGITYNWSPATGLSTTSGSVVSAAPASTNTYTVTATDANSCTATANSVVTINNTALSVTTSALPATDCVGKNTTLTATAVGGCIPFTYNWSNSLGTATTATTAIASAGANVYSVTVTDAAGNTVSSSVTVTGLALPAITFTANPTTSAICGSGNVVLTAGPAAQTSYAWSPSGGLSSTNTATTTATPALTTPYTVTVTGTNGCTASATQTVGVYGPVTASASVTTSPICYGTNTQLNSSGTQTGSPASTSAAGYTFLTAATGALDAMTGSTTLISNSVDDTPTSVQTFPAGFTFNFEGTNYTQYSVSPDGWLKLGGGAATAQFTNVVTSATNVPKLYPLWDDHATGTDGSVKALITGTAPNRIFKVQWKINTLSNSSLTNATFQLWMYETSNKVEFRYGTIGTVYGASVGITGLTSTNYNSVTISSNTTSNSSTNNANIVAPSNPRTYTFTPPVPFSTTYSYNWSNTSSYLSTTNISNPFANNVTAAENYTVTVTAANGCANTATVTVNINPLPTFTTVVTNVACLGANNGQIDVTPVVGTPTFTYSNNNGSTYQAGSNFSGLSPITYQVRVKDANGCISNAQAVSLTEPNALTATATNGSPYSTTVTANLFSTASGGTAPYTYAWSGPASFTSTLQNPTRSFTLVTMTGTYTVTVTDARGCTVTASTVMNVYDGYVWTGAVSSDWANNGNWSFQVPDYPDDCTQKSYIQTGTPFAPTVNIPGLTVGSITLVNGAVLTLANDITLCGNLIGSVGTLYSGVTGSGKFIMKSTPSVVQTITGKTRFVSTLRIENTAGVRVIGGNSQVVNALELKTGVLTVNNSGFFTFISTSSSQCAIIDNFSAGMTGSISGAVVMQRKYDAPTSPFYKTQHYMGSPVDQPLFTQFGANGVPGYIINTTCNERLSSPGSPFGDVAQYDENAPGAAACTLQGWKILNAGSAVNGRGYSVSKNGAGTLSLTGVPNQATSYARTGLTNSNWSNSTLQGYLDVSGWHMMSNPWLANLRITTNGGAGFDNQVAVWQTTGGFAGTFAYYQVGFDNVDIAPFQGFFVKKTTPGGTATYTINGSDRVRTPVNMPFQSLTNDHELSVYVDNNANGLRDKTIVAFNANATDGFDPIYDGNKLGGDPDRLSLYSVNNSLPMARNTLASINNTSTVDMNFGAGTSGAFTMSFEGLNSFDPTSYIMLEDKKTNTMYNVRNGNYAFTGDTADSKNRFVLHFTPAAEITQTDATCSTTGTINVTQPGTANWNYTVTDNSNVTVSSGILNQTTPIAVNANPGVYTITLVDNNNYTVAKQVQVTGMQQVVASFNTTANTVQQDDEVTFTATSTNATNHVWNFGDNSSSTGTTITHSYTAPGVYTAKLTSENNDCQSISTQQITVTAKTATGINTITDNKGIAIWSSENTVYVDMSRETKVEAQIEIYNVLGQQLSIEKFGRSSIYSKQFTNLEAAYVIVRVKNNNEIVTKKVFVVNSK